MSSRPVDLICLGRAAVDLYAEQIGSRLEDAQSFAKYVGGCAANIAVGSARLGLKVSMFTRLGDEHMGRFVRETFEREGVDTSHVVMDPDRLTGLVLLGIRNEDTFPLLFYRENCADMAMSVDDFDAGYIQSAKALLVTGTHFSQPQIDQVSRQAMAWAKQGGTRVILDIDYRPVLWGLTKKARGEDRYVMSQRVTEHFRSVLPDCDLIVGTEEEFCMAGGSDDTREAVAEVRRHSEATLVLKRGPEGCAVFQGEIPKTVEEASVEGFGVPVLNVLGAGDGFMSGFLSGWLRDEPLERCATLGNAVGALVVSRHGCAPAMPSSRELKYFLDHSKELEDVSKDVKLNHLHRVTTTRRTWPQLFVLALDNRLLLESSADRLEGGRARLDALKVLLARGAEHCAERTGLHNVGVIIDDRYGRDALHRVTGHGMWIARAVEFSGEVPLAFEDGPDVGRTLRSWPQEHIVKCLVRYRADDPVELRERQQSSLLQLYHACIATERELLVEILPPEGVAPSATEDAKAIEQLYAAGLYPDWWKLSDPARDEGWPLITECIDGHDHHCQGVLLLGGGASPDELQQSFRAAADISLCRGFAVGRTIFAEPSEEWLKGHINDDALIQSVSERLHALIEMWRNR